MVNSSGGIVCFQSYPCPLPGRRRKSSVSTACGATLVPSTSCGNAATATRLFTNLILGIVASQRIAWRYGFNAGWIGDIEDPVSLAGVISPPEIVLKQCQHPPERSNAAFVLTLVLASTHQSASLPVEHCSQPKLMTMRDKQYSMNALSRQSSRRSDRIAKLTTSFPVATMTQF